MTAPINLSQLREAATFDSAAQGAATMIVQQDVLLALIDLHDAAREVLDREARSEYTSIYAAPSEFAEILRGPMSRFTTDQPT